MLVRNKDIIHVQAPNGGGKRGSTIIAKMRLDDYLEENFPAPPLWIHVSHFAAAHEIKKAGGCWASVNNSFDKVKKPFHVNEIIRRAESMVGDEWDYDLFKNNCEHFAHWCRYGIKMCKQSPTSVQYVDEDGNEYHCAHVGGTNLGPVDFKLLSITAVREHAYGRTEHRVNAELTSVGVANLARASVGAGGTFGGYNDNDGLGFKAEAKYAEVDVGPANAKLGLAVSTGIDTKDGLKAEVLGTGFDVNSERLEVKVLGSSVAVTYPWNWFG